MKSTCRPLAVMCLCLSAVSVFAAASIPADDLAAASNAWRAGDLPGARDLLDQMIQSGTSDARAYYYRGLVDEQLGGTGDADFTAGAELEAATSSSRLVNRALERTQGIQRQRIEKLRTAARNRFKSDPAAAKRSVQFRDALAARATGDLPLALSSLNEIAVEGADARYFYMKGVVLAETGDLESARVAFRDGLRHEKTVDDSARVSDALANVQGEVRRLIEQETTVAIGGIELSRQTNSEQVRRMQMIAGDSLLAEADAASAAAAARLEAEREAARVAAGDAIAAANRARENQAALVADTIASQAEDAAAAANAAAVAAAEPEMPAETPLVADAAANPFFGGTSTLPTSPTESVPPAPSVSPGPIDMSYLPEQTELLFYVRPADLLASGFVQPLTALPPFEQAMAQMSQQIGFNATEIESVTVGMANLMATMTPIAMQAQGGTPPDPQKVANQLFGGENALAIVRTLRDFDAAALMQTAGGTSTPYESQTYYIIPNGDPNAPVMAMYPIDSRTFISASEDAVKAAISNGAGEANREAFAFVSRSSHIVQAYANPLLPGMSGAIPALPPTVPPPVNELVNAVKGKVAGVATSFSAGSDLAVQISLLLIDEESATAASGPLQQLAAMGQQMYPAVSGNVPPPLQQPVQQIVNSLKTSASSSVATISLTIPGSLVTTLMEHPELLGPAMGGGMPPGANPGFGPPGNAPPSFGSPGNVPPGNTPPAGNGAGQSGAGVGDSPVSE